MTEYQKVNSIIKSLSSIARTYIFNRYAKQEQAQDMLDLNHIRLKDLEKFLEDYKNLVINDLKVIL